MGTYSGRGISAFSTSYWNTDGLQNRHNTRSKDKKADNQSKGRIKADNNISHIPAPKKSKVNDGASIAMKSRSSSQKTAATIHQSGHPMLVSPYQSINSNETGTLATRLPSPNAGMLNAAPTTSARRHASWNAETGIFWIPLPLHEVTIITAGGLKAPSAVEYHSSAIPVRRTRSSHAYTRGPSTPSVREIRQGRLRTAAASSAGAALTMRFPATTAPTTSASRNGGRSNAGTPEGANEVLDLTSDSHDSSPGAPMDPGNPPGTWSYDENN